MKPLVINIAYERVHTHMDSAVCRTVCFAARHGGGGKEDCINPAKKTGLSSLAVH